MLLLRLNVHLYTTFDYNIAHEVRVFEHCELSGRIWSVCVGY